MFGIESNKVNNKGIYKDSIFVVNGVKMNATQQKSMRRKIRSQFIAGCKAICNASEKEFEKLANSFLKDYFATFANNDFTVASVTESKSTENRELFANALTKIKAFAESKSTEKKSTEKKK